MKTRKRRKQKEYYLTYKSSGYTDIIRAKSEDEAMDYFTKHSDKVTKYPQEINIDSIYLVDKSKHVPSSKAKTERIKKYKRSDKTRTKRLKDKDNDRSYDGWCKIILGDKYKKKKRTYKRKKKIKL